ncbi:MAG TPA: hypothetical protein VKP03_03060 [Patescibacteria group bacterium]|nr:hypothetical protein [Patescibacteria group bacterium]
MSRYYRRKNESVRSFNRRSRINAMFDHEDNTKARMRLDRLQLYKEKYWPDRELRQDLFDPDKGFRGRSAGFSILGLIHVDKMEFADGKTLRWYEYCGYCTDEGKPIYSLHWLIFKLVSLLTFQKFDSKGRRGSDSCFFEVRSIYYNRDWRSVRYDWYHWYHW